MVSPPASSPPPTPLTVAFAGGYSAGHLTPGFALAAQLLQAHPASRVLFVGAAQGPEATLVPQRGFPFYPIRSQPFVQRGRLRQIGALGQLPASVVQAIHLFKTHDVNLLVVLGSHAAVAPALAAAALGLPYVVLEANHRFGLTTSLLAYLARRIYTGALFEETLTHRLAAKHRAYPMPLAHRAAASTDGRPKPPAPGAPIQVLVLAGSRDHALLNQKAPHLLDQLRRRGYDVQVCHQCGLLAHPAPIAAQYAALGLHADVAPYLDPIALRYAEAHVALTAAGAITLYELAAMGLPTVLFPLAEAAAGHQAANAQRFATATGCFVAPPSTWPEAALLAHLEQLIATPTLWHRQSEAQRQFGASSVEGTLLADMLAACVA